MDWGLLGLLAVFMCPMVFGGITMYYSAKAIEPPKTDHQESHSDEKSSDH